MKGIIFNFNEAFIKVTEASTISVNPFHEHFWRLSDRYRSGINFRHIMIVTKFHLQNQYFCKIRKGVAKHKQEHKVIE